MAGRGDAHTKGPYEQDQTSTSTTGRLRAELAAGTGTAFHDHKLPLRKILAAMVVFVANVKGISAPAMARQIEVAYMTAFVMLHKFREMMTIDAQADPGPPMEGIVHMDGAHVSGKLRKPRVKSPATRTQARDKLPHSAFPNHENRRIVMSVRELFEARREGASRTAVAVVRAEDEETIGILARQYIAPGATVMTDELSGYNRLGTRYDHRTVNHSREFSTDEGTSNNQSESYFARVRRFIIGQVHRVTPIYMLEYMTEMAWREDNRRQPPSSMVSRLLHLHNLYESKKWFGYWQRRRQPSDDTDGALSMEAREMLADGDHRDTG